MTRLFFVSIAWAALVFQAISDSAAGASPDPFVSACAEPDRSLAVRAIPGRHRFDPELVALGRKLFHDLRLSRDGTIACASCHVIAQGGDDGRPTSIGVGGASGSMNAPSVLNRAFDFRFFWDGRAATLEDQVNGPLEHPKEMASSWKHVESLLASDSDYVERFASLGLPRSSDSVRTAIATFERSLITPDAPFDRYLCGDENALSNGARAGWERFRSLGCVSCHQGVNLGGNLYERFGVFVDPSANHSSEPGMLGRFDVTGRPEDRFVFKVPSLRNVELTAPYFHDGSAATLEEAVHTMGLYQLGRDLAEEDVELLVSFLRSLTGRLPE